MKDPMPYVAQYPQADVLTSSDHLVCRLLFCHAHGCAFSIMA